MTSAVRAVRGDRTAHALGGVSSAVTLGGARASYGAVRVRARASLGSRHARGKRLVVEAMFEVRAIAVRAGACDGGKMVLSHGATARRDARRDARGLTMMRSMTTRARTALHGESHQGGHVGARRGAQARA